MASPGQQGHHSREQNEVKQISLIEEMQSPAMRAEFLDSKMNVTDWLTKRARIRLEQEDLIAQPKDIGPEGGGGSKNLYEPLAGRKIRLIRLPPLARDDTRSSVSLTIEVHDLDDCPNFRALSYTWGPPQHWNYITVNSHQFVVRRNLFDFLITFPIAKPGELFWIDQICINQKSVQERNAQVPLMGDIYRQASQVVVWLGRDTSQYRQASRTAASQIAKNGHKGINQLPWGEPSVMHACSQFIGLPYWTRLWIVQEVLLARSLRVRWGGEDFDWGDVVNLFAAVTINSRIHRFVCQALRNTRTLDPTYALDIAATSQCQDKKDLCFGIQSLLADTFRITVDYCRTIEEVLEDMTLTMLRYHAGDSIPKALADLGVAMGVYHRHNDRSSQLRMVQQHYHGGCKHWKEGGLECALEDEPLIYSRSGDLSWRAEWSIETWREKVHWAMGNQK